MSSKLVNRGIMGLAASIGEIIRKGRPIPTVIGFLLGTAIGASTAFVSMYLFGPALGIGCITGVTIGAALFPRPPQMKSDDPSLAWGKVRHRWTFQWETAACFTAMMDRAIFVVNAKPSIWNDVVEQLNQGVRPDLESSNLIRFATIDRLEIPRFGRLDVAHELMVVYVSRGKVRRRTIEFQLPSDRDEFIEALASLTGTQAAMTEEPMERGRAICVPLILVLVAVLLTAGITALSAHWTAEPPRPPVGKQEQDELVRLLIWAGPTGVLLAGGVVLLILLGWLYKRILYPPQLQVVRLQMAANPS